MMHYLNAFIFGGFLCAIAQLLIDFTKMTPARILVLYVTAGVVLTFLGLYNPLVERFGAGATVPLTGFGNALANGVIKGIGEKTEKLFRKLEIVTAGDLLRYYPKDYEAFQDPVMIKDASPGEVSCVRVCVIGIPNLKKVRNLNILNVNVLLC